MTREVVPSACHHTEMLLRYLRKRTPKVLIIPAGALVWLSSCKTKRQLTLREHDRAIDPNRLARGGLEIGADGA